MAFFKLLALSMSCSRGRNIWGRAVQAEPTESSLEESPALPDPSPSSVSSAIVGGGLGREEDAWDSSFSVFSNESSFSFRTEHYMKKNNIWVELSCLGSSFLIVLTELLLSQFSENQRPVLHFRSRSPKIFSNFTFLAMTSDSSELSVAFS